MANEIENALNAVCDYLEANVPAAKRVILAFPDERVDVADDEHYPAIAVSIYDAQPAVNQQRSGPIGFRNDQPDGKTTLITKPPTPINLFFQVDTLSEKRSDAWALSTRCLQLLNTRNLIIANPLGKDLQIFRGTMQSLDQLERDTLWRKSFRFHAPVWFDHPDAAETAYLILKTQLDMQGESYELKTGVA